jgi:hypothetical protein
MPEVKFWEKTYRPEDKVTIPAHYEFVESGVHFLTRTIKRLCEEQGLTVYTQMRKGREFSRAVGYHAPPDVIREAERLRDMTASQRAVQRTKSAAYRAKKECQYQKEFVQRIKELFPGIPPDEPEDIADRACEVSSERVGRSRQIDLDKKVELAVAAHARHQHTCYEECLQDIYDDEDEYLELRRGIKGTVEGILRRWRQADGNEGDDGDESKLRTEEENSQC